MEPGMRTSRTIYEFDDFRVDSGQFLIYRSGHVSAITPTVFRLLLILLQRAGQIVSKEDLTRFVWPDIFVAPGNLNRNISTLRKALDERPSDHRYIETVPKMGYRFVAAVRSLDYQPPTGAAQKAASAAVRIVGRENERNELCRLYELVEQGQGNTVFITGDAGIGKTSLVDLFLKDLIRGRRNFHVMKARCSESLTESEPFLTWIESVAGFAHETAIEGLLTTAAPNWHREIQHMGSGTPQQMKREMLDFCKQVAQVHPLVIVLEDFQWADVASVDLLTFLADRIHSSRILIVVTNRPDDVKLCNHALLQVRSDLISRRLATELRLAFLQRQDVDRYVRLTWPEREFPADYPAVLHAQCDGNPLFMNELIRCQSGIPDAAQYLLEKRIQRLDEKNRTLLVAASVQGREFDSAVLAQSLDINPAEVEERLQFMDETHGLIQRIREQELPNGKMTIKYRFVYALCQEICHTSVTATRKASLNSSLAEAFLTYYGH
jgi:DNA-binding winged helix-turn-helix (wHTH) protein